MTTTVNFSCKNVDACPFKNLNIKIIPSFMYSLPSQLAYNIHFRSTRVGNHPATVLETFGCWPRFWVCLNLFDLSNLYSALRNRNEHTYIHPYYLGFSHKLQLLPALPCFASFGPCRHRHLGHIVTQLNNSQYVAV